MGKLGKKWASGVLEEIDFFFLVYRLGKVGDEELAREDLD